MSHAIHPAWNLLFFDPSFWTYVGKHGFSLRGVCKSFRDEIPNHLAIAAVFRAKRCRKVVLFRLLPLSVNDVVGMKSPTIFMDAFSIAIRKAGGFDNCMALLRDKGWRSWCEADAKRRVAKERVNVLITKSGFSGLIDSQNPVYISAISTRRRVDRAVVWQYSCTYEGLLPWEQYNPLESGVRRAQMLHSSVECRTLLRILHDAVGFWYKGIHGDMFSIESSIRNVRERGVQLVGNTLQHQLISGGVLIIGEITFNVWVPPPNRIMGI